MVALWFTLSMKKPVQFSQFALLDFDPDSLFVSFLPPLVTYFRNYAPLFSKDEIEVRHSVTIDYAEFSQNCLIPDFATHLRDIPSRVLTIMELAIYEVLKTTIMAQGDGWGGGGGGGGGGPPDSVTQLQASTASTSAAGGGGAAAAAATAGGGGTGAGELLPRISVCLSNYEPLTPLKDLKANLMGKFIGVRGTVVRVSSIKPSVMQGCFVCNSCQGRQVIKFCDGKYSLPTRCAAGGCKGKSFQLDRSSPETITADWQKVK